jgi:hypothetical protein
VISTKRYRKLFEKQGGVCAACGEPEYFERGDRRVSALVPDQKRALLCLPCLCAVIAIELAGDPQLFVDYLERFSK